MTNFLHWRKMTWALVLWSGYVATWAVITDSGPTIVTLWWLAGMILFGTLWLGTQPLFQRGRGLSGFLVSARLDGLARRQLPPRPPGHGAPA